LSAKLLPASRHHDEIRHTSHCRKTRTRRARSGHNQAAAGGAILDRETHDMMPPEEILKC
jgi:hypothetical protein